MPCCAECTPAMLSHDLHILQILTTTPTEFYLNLTNQTQPPNQPVGNRLLTSSLRASCSLLARSRSLTSAARLRM